VEKTRKMMGKLGKTRNMMGKNWGKTRNMMRKTKVSIYR